MSFHTGVKIFCFFILLTGCHISRLGVPEDSTNKLASFKDRLASYKSDVNRWVNNNKKVDYQSNDKLVYFTYATYKGDCNDIAKDNNVLENTFFTINSSYTFILDQHDNYRASIWHNGYNKNPENLNSYEEHLRLQKSFLDNEYVLMYQYTNCDVATVFCVTKDSRIDTLNLSLPFFF